MSFAEGDIFKQSFNVSVRLKLDILSDERFSAPKEWDFLDVEEMRNDPRNEIVFNNLFVERVTVRAEI